MNKGMVLLFGMLLSLFLMGSQINPQPDEVLFKTVKKLNVEVHFIVYHYGGRSSKWMLTSKVNSFVQQLAKNFNCSSIRKYRDDNGIHYQAEKKEANSFTKLHVLNDRPNQIWSKPFVSIQLIRSNPENDRANFVYQQWRKRLTDQWLSPNVHFTIQGSRPLKQGTEKDIIVQAFQLLKAKQIEGIHTKRLISLSANSTILPLEGLQTKNGRMNVQVAAKVDRKQDRLLFTIGSPIITIEY